MRNSVDGPFCTAHRTPPSYTRPETLPAFSTSRAVTVFAPGHGAPTGVVPPQSFAVPFVEIVGANGPLPFGQRPYVLAACAVHACASTSAPAASNTRAESAPPRPKPNCASSSTRYAPGASVVPAGSV